MNQQLVETLKPKESKMIEIGRYLHRHPESSFHEGETAKYIAELYKGKDVEIETSVGPHGIRVTIDSGKLGKILAARADFDTLPITGDTRLSFTSQDKGVMHACDRDAHTAYMLALAETLAEMKDSFTRKVVMIHQPAKEVPPGGAKTMIENSVLDGVDHVLGVHVMSTMKTGKMYYGPGHIQTGHTFFELRAQGKGGHGSSPHMANDAIVAGSYFVTALQTVVSRRLSPFEAGVVTIGSFDGRGQFNAIRSVIEIEGDVRGLANATKAIIKKEIKRLSEGLEDTYGATCTLEYNDDYPTLCNNPKFTEYVAETLKKANLDSGIKMYKPQPPSEDFTYYAKEHPSTFIYTGAAAENGGIYPHHHPKFNTSEKSLPISAEVVGTVVLDYLRGDN